MSRWMDGSMNDDDRYIDGQMIEDGQTDGWMDGQMDGRTDG